MATEDIGNIRQILVEDEMRSSYLDYAMSVITARALPDVRDGLKPAQRRILVAMNDLNLAPNRGYLPPARRSRGLPDAGTSGATIQYALPAGRWPGQLRVSRRRSAGGHAL